MDTDKNRGGGIFNEGRAERANGIFRMTEVDGRERDDLRLDNKFWAKYTFFMAKDRRHGERGGVQTTLPIYQVTKHPVDYAHH
jgi:hypothetical protein